MRILPQGFPDLICIQLSEFCRKAVKLPEFLIADSEKGYRGVRAYSGKGGYFPALLLSVFFRHDLQAGEDRCLIPSPKQFPTYDLIPEMSARPVTDECVKRILSGEYDVVICNLANCDMVGHTGVKAAAVKAVETVDECVGRMTDAVLEMGGVILITADHGNADRIMKPDGSPDTAHTTNPVPLIVAGAGELQLKSGRLCDLCPTMLELMGIPQPAEMTGESLIVK